jgi:hypothetical protein
MAEPAMLRAHIQAIFMPRAITLILQERPILDLPKDQN